MVKNDDQWTDSQNNQTILKTRMVWLKVDNQSKSYTLANSKLKLKICCATGSCTGSQTRFNPEKYCI